MQFSVNLFSLNRCFFKRKLIYCIFFFFQCKYTISKQKWINFVANPGQFFSTVTQKLKHTETSYWAIPKKKKTQAPGLRKYFSEKKKKKKILQFLGLSLYP